MVSIVLVSHSKEMSEAVKALAEQQIQGRVAIAAVGGSDNPFQPFGTDPVAIADAIQAVWSLDGVLVLMDLGSAVISAQVALDLLEPTMTARVQLSVGPFLEGAIAAAVQASIGMDLDAVASESEAAIRVKRAVLLDNGADPPPAPVTAPETANNAQQFCADVTVINPVGLHFGPAVRFVQAVAQFQAKVTVTNLTTDAGPADATRFNQLLTLGVEQYHRIRIIAEGPDAAEAVQTLTELIANDVGDAPATPPTQARTPVIDGRGAAVLHGLAASAGVALGTAVVLGHPRDLLTAPLPGEQPERDNVAEWTRLQAALGEANRQLEKLAAEVQQSLGDDQATIFRAHRLLLADEDILQAVRACIVDASMNAGAAVQRVYREVAGRFSTMAGTVFQQRAADIEDVARRLLGILLGEVEQPVVLPDNAIIVAHDLSPSQTATLDRSKVVGFCTAAGGPTAHTAILARSMGLPAVVGIGAALLEQVTAGVTLAIDGAHGQVIVAPDGATSAAYGARQQQAHAERRAAWGEAQRPALTRDGARVEVVANLGAAADVAVALAAGAEGAGLLRTEFLFQERVTPPTEEEQFAIYRQVAEQLGKRPLIVRTLDIGGDKPAPYLPLPHEANPFLGWRAIRALLTMPEFFKTQIRALLRAAVYGNVHILYPMVSSASELVQIYALQTAAVNELQAANLPHKGEVPTGIMIEVPAAVQMADQLASLVDFFSIGTNDLTQYTFAADRTNARVADLADALHPAVLRQIDMVIRAAHTHGKWCGLCGELAGQPEAIPVLLGLGLDEFSMAPAHIPAAKQMISQLTIPVSRRLAQKALTLPDGDAVRQAVRQVIHQ
jgi:phosphoenolpyruvate-protein phosphotransferase/dihydroxyacetone kinase phosphotransfer subunit